mmetsp:Transcript_31199/g.71844  ORF Transcript_31199/g.71844 Transcript_31199/m.71844 type:complete len:93 (+) Transcript_31199:78-356(+)
MFRIAVLFAILVAVAQAFTVPSRAASGPAFARVQTAQKMMVDPSEMMTAVSQTSHLVAANADDFGGITFPILGLLTIGGIIIYFAPPLADPK